MAVIPGTRQTPAMGVAHRAGGPMTAAQQSNIVAVARDVRRAAPMALATTYGATVSGQDGGYAVPVDMAESILMPETGSLLRYCLQVPVTQGGSIDIPLDSATIAGSGVIAAWESEGAVLPQRKPNLNLTHFELRKLVALVPVTDELLQDSAALAAWLPLAMQQAVTLKVNEAIVAGLGAGRPLGIMNSDSLIEVAKYSGQTAGTIIDANIAAMLARSLSPMTSIWIANPAAYEHITLLTLFDAPTQTLAGMPIVLSDSCSAVGTPGDLILADMSWYVVAMKTPQLNGSMHLWFDEDVTAFKLVFRMEGMPALVAPITPLNSSTTKSHFVTTALRA